MVLGGWIPGEVAWFDSKYMTARDSGLPALHPGRLRGRQKFVMLFLPRPRNHSSLAKAISGGAGFVLLELVYQTLTEL